MINSKYSCVKILYYKINILLSSELEEGYIFFLKIE